MWPATFWSNIVFEVCWYAYFKVFARVFLVIRGTFKKVKQEVLTRSIFSWVGILEGLGFSGPTSPNLFCFWVALFLKEPQKVISCDFGGFVFSPKSPFFKVVCFYFPSSFSSSLFLPFKLPLFVLYFSSSTPFQEPSCFYFSFFLNNYCYYFAFSFLHVCLFLVWVVLFFICFYCFLLLLFWKYIFRSKGCNKSFFKTPAFKSVDS